MRLLLDTQFLVWMVNGDKRLKPAWIKELTDKDNSLHVSAVIAFEYTDLLLRGRLPVDEPLAELIERFDLLVEDLPADSWRIASDLPMIHRDPVDRMFVAHAIIGGYALATADANLRKYKVQTI